MPEKYWGRVDWVNCVNCVKLLAFDLWRLWPLLLGAEECIEPRIMWRGMRGTAGTSFCLESVVVVLRDEREKREKWEKRLGVLLRDRLPLRFRSRLRSRMERLFCEE